MAKTGASSFAPAHMQNLQRPQMRRRLKPRLLYQSGPATCVCPTGSAANTAPWGSGCHLRRSGGQLLGSSLGSEEPRAERESRHAPSANLAFAINNEAKGPPPHAGTLCPAGSITHSKPLGVDAGALGQAAPRGGTEIVLVAMA